MSRRLVIADRRDLLGGRLSALLNAQRIAHKINGKLAFSWYEDDSPFQRLVAGASDLFADEFLKPYDRTSALGFLLPADWSTQIAATRERKGLPSAEGGKFDLGQYLVKPIFDQNEDIAYWVDTNLSLYSLNGEDEHTIRRELSEEFERLPLRSELRVAMKKIDAWTALKGSSVSIHVRRMHLYQETLFTHNRFHSYVGTPIVCEVIKEMLTRWDHVIFGSDNGFLVHKIREMFGEKVSILSDVIDTKEFSEIQRAMLDIYFLSRGKRILGPISAFSFTSSLIGGIPLEHLFDVAAQLDVQAPDPTGGVGYRKYKLENNFDLLDSPLFKPYADRPCLLLFLGQRHSDKAFGMELLIEAAAIEFTQYVHRVFGGDFQHYTYAIIRKAEALGDANVAAFFVDLQDMVSRRIPRSSAEISDAEVRLLNVPDRSRRLCLAILSAALGDISYEHGAHVEAVRHYTNAERVVNFPWLEMRGVRIRLAAAHRARNDESAEIVALRRAVEADPRFPYALLELSLALSRQGHFSDAETILSDALSIDDEIGPIWAARGETAVAQGRITDAIAYFETALNCDPQEARRYRERLAGIAQAPVQI